MFAVPAMVARPPPPAPFWAALPTCRELFAIEAELGVATVFWRQIILWIADLADFAERVGNRLRRLLAH